MTAAAAKLHETKAARDSEGGIDKKIDAYRGKMKQDS
jgi:hypothetical protein